MPKSRLFCLVAVLWVASTVSAASINKTILKVLYPDQVWNKMEVTEKLITRLSRNSSLRVINAADLEDDQPSFPNDSYNLDSLYDWGAEIGGRYLLFVSIDNSRLERRKTFQIPLIVHKYQTLGVIEGELRFLDISRGKLLAAESFTVEQKGPRIIQAYIDGDVNDSDLHISAPQKLLFFSKLEEKLVKHLVNRIKHITNDR